MAPTTFGLALKRDHKVPHYADRKGCTWYRVRFVPEDQDMPGVSVGQPGEQLNLNDELPY